MLCTSLALAGALAAAPSAVQPALTTVRVAEGQLSGIPGSIAVFKGVPFAAPPIGSLRWRAPQPVSSWSGVRKADAFPANCVQTIVDALTQITRAIRDLDKRLDSIESRMGN